MITLSILRGPADGATFELAGYKPPDIWPVDYEGRVVVYTLDPHTSEKVTEFLRECWPTAKVRYRYFWDPAARLEEEVR